MIDQVGSVVNRYLPQGSLRRRLLDGTFWMLAGNGVAQGATFAVTLICARLLGSEVFGKYGIIQSTLALFGLFASFGMGLTNQRYVGELRGQNPERCGQILGFSVVVTLCSAGTLSMALLISAPWIAGGLLNAPDLVLELRISAAILLLSSLNDIQAGAVAGLEHFSKLARVSFARAVLSPVLLIGGVWLGGLSGLLIGMAVLSLFVWLLTHRVLHESLADLGIVIRYDHVMQEKDILWRFTIPAIASGALPALVFWMARTILIQYPDGYAQLGVLAAAEQWLVVQAFVPGQISNVSQPILSNVYATGSRVRFRRGIVVAIVLPVAVALVLALLLIVASNPVTALYGETYSGLSSVLVVICLVGVLRVLGGAVGVLLVTVNRMWVGFGVNVLWGLTLVVATVMLVAQGALGIAYANLIAYGVHACLGLGVLYWYLTRPWGRSSPMSARTGR